MNFRESAYPDYPLATAVLTSKRAGAVPQPDLLAPTATYIGQLKGVKKAWNHGISGNSTSWQKAKRRLLLALPERFVDRSEAQRRAEDFAQNNRIAQILF